MHRHTAHCTTPHSTITANPAEVARGLRNASSELERSDRKNVPRTTRVRRRRHPRTEEISREAPSRNGRMRSMDETALVCEINHLIESIIFLMDFHQVQGQKFNPPTTLLHHQRYVEELSPCKHCLVCEGARRKNKTAVAKIFLF